MSKFLEKVADVLDLLDSKTANAESEEKPVDEFNGLKLSEESIKAIKQNPELRDLILQKQAAGQKPDSLGEPAQKVATNSKPNSVQDAWAAFGENITR